ncbi:type II secretion system F family protein [Allonocardiopsis opalescens]|uniref:Tight adherence protein B n=1 Tax=Allonocardiopsis opalescens TaxID=1144618 RepID=A0A2T0Q6P7_9ACTN|nr:type II secretion system F family protein [Allonocardiopsis opalescens]PRX99474.1 tight adherence protein B [Allonocardiopsis opalescens]
MTALAAAACVGLAVWLLGSAAPGRVRLRRLRPSGGAPVRSLPDLRRAVLRGGERELWQRAVVELCAALAAELHAGRTAADALAAAADEAPPAVAARLAPVAAAARSGDDPVDALVALSRLPGAGGLAYLAACWRVGAGTGAGFAQVADRLADTLADGLARRRETAAQLAGPRTTAILLAALPAAGLALATSLDERPLAFLLGTPAGLACLAAGITLDAAGLWWTLRISSRACTAQELR